MCHSKTSWKKKAEPKVRPVVEHLSNLGECCSGFCDSCSVIRENGDGLSVVFKWSAGACPVQHIDTVLVVVARGFPPGFLGAKLRCDRSIITSVSSCSMSRSSFETDVVELDPVVSGTPSILMLHRRVQHITFISELCHLCL